MLELRDYQRECVNKILWEKKNNLPGNSICCLPTGAGKSIVIAHIAHALNEPILILQPSLEILNQNYEKLCRYADPSEIGIYSASAGRKDIGYYTLATIQSIYKQPEFFKQFKLVLIDECHLVNPSNLGGMFTSFLKAIGNPKIIGLTATPYRMDTMYVFEGKGMMRATATTKLINRLKGMFWSRLLYNVNVGDLTAQGYLCPLEYKDMSLMSQDLLTLNKYGTDFDLDLYVKTITDKSGQIHDAIRYASGAAKSIIVFCASIAQATRLSAETADSAVVTGKTPAKERARIIDGFKNGDIKIVFNVGVLTTGFDHPSLDCIVLARPTRSIGLYYQMLGRGVRNSPGKTRCLVIDLTSTVKTLGRVETIQLVKRDKWELESETGSWHNKELFSFAFERKPKEKSEQEKAKDQIYAGFQRG